MNVGRNNIILSYGDEWGLLGAGSITLSAAPLTSFHPCLPNIHGALRNITPPTAPRLEMSGSTVLAALQTKIWAGKVPLEIRLAPQDCKVYDQTDPYIVSPSRVLAALTQPVVCPSHFLSPSATAAP